MGNGLTRTGKTLTTIAITGALSQAGRIRRVLIVAPIPILWRMGEEFQKFCCFPVCAGGSLSGNSAKKLDTLRHMNGTALQVVVVNYESAWRLEKAFDRMAPRPDYRGRGPQDQNPQYRRQQGHAPDGPGQATGSCSPVRLSPTRPLMCSASINSEPGHLREQLLCLPQPCLL